MAGAATVEKALDVLFHLHDAGGALGLSEIGRALDLPKSSCHRLLASLVDREIVDRDASGHYRPGLALLSLGIGAQGREPVVAAARPIIEREVRALGETVFVVGRRRGRLRVLDKLEGSGFLRAAPDVGDVIPGDVTAAGQVYRAFDPTSAAVAQDDILRAGYATNRDAWIEGLSVLAVPIWQRAGGEATQLVGALALAAASARFDRLGEERIADRMLPAADAISRRLGVGSGPGDFRARGSRKTGEK